MHLSSFVSISRFVLFFLRKIINFNRGIKWNKKLGNTDIDVSLICLGTMTWGQQNTQEEGFEQMDYALEQGVNF